MAHLKELWDIYKKMPLPKDFPVDGDYESELFAWCIAMENKFHELAAPDNLFENNPVEEGKE